MLSFWKQAKSEYSLGLWRGPRLYLFQGHNYNMISIPLVLQGETVLCSKEEWTVTQLQIEGKSLQIHLANSLTITFTCCLKPEKVSQDANATLSFVKISAHFLMTCRTEDWHIYSLLLKSSNICHPLPWKMFMVLDLRLSNYQSWHSCSCYSLSLFRQVLSAQISDRFPVHFARQKSWPSFYCSSQSKIYHM